MDYKKTIAALAVAATATVATAEIVSSSVVGYQNKGFTSGYNYVANTFVPVGGERESMTLGDIKPNSEFIASTIQFLTSGGATAKVTVEGLGTVKAVYSYWTEADGPSDGAGWYLDADENQEFNQNNRIVPFGDAYCVERDALETDAQLVYSGEVDTAPVTKSFNSGYNYIGNCAPTNLTLGDITPNEEFIASTIQFLTSAGATAKVTVEGLGTVKAVYSYWTEADGPSDGAGWYLDADENQEYNQNGRIIEAGSAFCVERDALETEATLTIPSAL